MLLGTGLAGACLAAPVLTGQFEFYQVGIRRSSHLFHPLSVLAGPGSLTAVYPWCLGTFRTLDLGKFCGPTSLGFSLFIGPAAFVLAVLGALRPLPRVEWRALKWIALGVCAAYLLIISTPLVNMFYMRIAPMAVMGLIVLAAIGLETLSTDSPWLRRTGRLVLAGAVAVVIVTNLFAWFVYPRIQNKVLQAVKGTTGSIDRLGPMPRLRAFQVENLPREISFANPEPLLAFAGLLGLAALLLSAKLRARPSLWCGLLLLNLAPVLWFTHRFIPHPPVALWQKLLAGGPEQQRVMAQMRDPPPNVSGESRRQDTNRSSSSRCRISTMCEPFMATRRYSHTVWIGYHPPRRIACASRWQIGFTKATPPGWGKASFARISRRGWLVSNGLIIKRGRSKWRTSV